MSSTERLANEFDLELHRLMRRAEFLRDDSRVPREAYAWKEVAELLGRARRHARSMMHEADRDRSAS